MAENEYTIDIPGATDIIHIPVPGIDDVELKKARIARMKTAKSPIPEVLDWIPSAITAIDDLQDLLYVGLTIAKPALRRLPARFIPGLGWALTAMDIMNLATHLLAIPTTGAIAKRNKMTEFNLHKTTKLSRIKQARDFLGKTALLPFLIQAGQVTDDLFGYGLQLGPLMGSLSESVWGAIRYAQGADINIRLPPPEDPLGKAVRWLQHSWVHHMIPDAFSKEDHELMIAGDNVAIGILQDNPDMSRLDMYGETILNYKMPVYTPWNEASKAALLAGGFDLTAQGRNLIGLQETTTTFADSITKMTQYRQTYNKYMPDVWGGDLERASVMQMIYKEAGYDWWDVQAEGQQGHTYSWLPAELAFIRAMENGIAPPPTITKIATAQWLNTAFTAKKLTYKTASWRWCLLRTMPVVFGSWCNNGTTFEPNVINKKDCTNGKWTDQWPWYSPYTREPYLPRTFAPPTHTFPWKRYRIDLLTGSNALWKKEIDDLAESIGSPRFFHRAFNYDSLKIL